MEQNPIKYSDLISPDDSIEKLITQLESLQTVYGEMASSVRSQAAGVANSLKMVSGATAEGQQRTRQAAKDADDLEKAYRALDKAYSDNAKEIAKLNVLKREANNYNKMMVLRGKEEIDTIDKITKASYQQLSAQYSLNKAYINNLNAEERLTKENKQFIETTKAIYEQMKKLQEETGKYTLNVGNYENAITSAIGVNTRWYQGIKDIGVLFEGGFSNGMKAAGSAVTAFWRKMLAMLANPIVLTIAVITAAFVALSKAISSSEENTNTLSRILAPFQRVLTGVMAVLQDVAGAILRTVEGFEKLAMGASRLMERLPLVGSTFKKVNDALQENINLTIRKQQLDKQERQTSVDIAKIEANIAKFRRDAEMTDDPKRRIQLLKMADLEEQRIMNKRLALAEEDYRIKKARAEQSQNDKQTNDELAQSEVNLYNVRAEYYRKTTKLQSKIRANEGRLNRSAGGGGGSSPAASEVDVAKLKLEEQRQIEDARISLIEDSFLRERFTVITAYDRIMQDVREKYGEETELILLLEKQKQQKLADLVEKEAKAQEDRERKDLEARIKAIDMMEKAERERQAAQRAREAEELRMMEERKEAIRESVEFAIGYINEYMDAWMAAAEQRLDYAEKEVDRTKTALEQEIEARNNGYAANVALAQKEFDQARKQQQKALQEQRRAQKAQEMIDTAMQVSSLVTATANIWKAFTGAGPWGIALAIAATALMFGSFAAAKIKAATVSGAGGGEEQYGEGTVELLQGGSHQSGSDIDLGRKKDGTRRRAEGGEYFAVINRRNSRRFREIIPDVINSLNDGTFAQKYQRAYADGGLQVSVQTENRELRGMASDVRLIREQGEQRVSYDASGNEIVQYKNLRRIIRK